MESNATLSKNNHVEICEASHSIIVQHIITHKRCILLKVIDNIVNLLPPLSPSGSENCLSTGLVGVVTENILKVICTISDSETRQKFKLTVGQYQSVLIQDREPPQCLTCQETHCECHPNKETIKMYHYQGFPTH